MRIDRLLLAGALASAALPFPIAAQGPACVEIEDALTRLDCYDRAAGRGRAAPQAQPSGEVAPGPPPAAADLPQRPAAASPAPPVGGDAAPRPPFSSRIVAVERLPQGYHRMLMENGAAYQTIEPVAPLPVGTQISLRRTLAGSSYMHSDGRNPLAVRRSRRR